MTGQRLGNEKIGKGGGRGARKKSCPSRAICERLHFWKRSEVVCPGGREIRAIARSEGKLRNNVERGERVAKLGQ